MVRENSRESYFVLHSAADVVCPSCGHDGTDLVTRLFQGTPYILFIPNAKVLGKCCYHKSIPAQNKAGNVWNIQSASK